MLTVLRRLCGHASAEPSGVFRQSRSRMRPPISPPPCRNVRLDAPGDNFSGIPALSQTDLGQIDEGAGRRVVENSSFVAPYTRHMRHADTGSPFPIVGVGASAGGIDAVTRLLTALPRESGLALVVVQHLDPHHESQLSAILKGRSSMKVDDATHGLKVERNHVYVIQPNTNVAITDGMLSVTARPDDRRPHYPIDHFLRSLAAVQGRHAVGVILSGTGSDGTLGLSEIKAVGGVTFAQDDQSAQHRGMPQSAVASGAVDLVLPPEGIAQQLAELPAHPYLAASDAARPADDGDGFR